MRPRLRKSMQMILHAEATHVICGADHSGCGVGHSWKAIPSKWGNETERRGSIERLVVWFLRARERASVTKR